MKTKTILLLFALGAATFFAACHEEETPKPEIENFELGYDNNKTTYAGGDLHIEAEILAPGKIDRVQIIIHKHGDHDHKSTLSGNRDTEWQLDTTYNKFSGLRNTKFHEHIDVPEDAEAGNYALHFTVVDLEGNLSDREEELFVEHEHLLHD